MDKAEEELGAKAQLARMRRLVAQEAKKGEEVDAAVLAAEEALPPPPDPEEQRKVLDGQLKRREQLHGLAAKVREGASMLAREQEAVGKSVAELEKLKGTLEGLQAELKQASKAVEQTRREAEMEKSLGDAERMEAHYEEYVSKLLESARREKEKEDAAVGALAKLEADWAAWLAILVAGARVLQSRSDAGNALAKAVVDGAGGGDGGGASVAGAAAGSAEAGPEARLAAMVVESAARSEAKLTHFRRQARELDAVEAECAEKLKKANEKIQQHQNLYRRAEPAADKAKGGGKAKAKGRGGRRVSKADDAAASGVTLPPVASTT